MKNQILKITAMILIVALLLVPASGCGGTADVYSEWIDLVEAPDDSSTAVSSSETENNTTSTDTSLTVEAGSEKKNSSGESVIENGNIKVTKNGKTLFKIVASLSNDGYDQARLIQKVIKATTGVSVPLIVDYEDRSGAEILVGKTNRKESESAIADLAQNEYAIKSDSLGNIIIVGTSVTALEISTKEFLAEYFGYDENAAVAGKEKSIPMNLNIKKNIFESYKLVWSDDFNGTRLDDRKWRLHDHMHEQTDLKVLKDERAVKVKDGTAVLSSGRLDENNYFTNSALTTDTTMIFKYGYVEMRAKVPYNRPAFPSFWMKSSEYKRANPYVMSEIDIFECFGTPETLHSGYHKWYQDGTNEHAVIPGNQKTLFKFNNEKEAEQWHNYGLWWTPTSLNFMVDGKIYQTNNITDKNDYGTRGDGMGAHHDYHYLIMNNYLYTPKGGSLDGGNSQLAATANDIFPINYIIDYVRIYQKPGEGDLIVLSE